MKSTQQKPRRCSFAFWSIVIVLRVRCAAFLGLSSMTHWRQHTELGNKQTQCFSQKASNGDLFDLCRRSPWQRGVGLLDVRSIYGSKWKAVWELLRSMPRASEMCLLCSRQSRRRWSPTWMQSDFRISSFFRAKRQKMVAPKHFGQTFELLKSQEVKTWKNLCTFPSLMLKWLQLHRRRLNKSGHVLSVLLCSICFPFSSKEWWSGSSRKIEQIPRFNEDKRESLEAISWRILCMSSSLMLKWLKLHRRCFVTLCVWFPGFFA